MKKGGFRVGGKTYMKKKKVSTRFLPGQPSYGLLGESTSLLRANYKPKF
jgi:hypothetical protein